MDRFFFFFFFFFFCLSEIKISPALQKLVLDRRTGISRTLMVYMYCVVGQQIGSSTRQGGNNDTGIVILVLEEDGVILRRKFDYPHEIATSNKCPLLSLRLGMILINAQVLNQYVISIIRLEKVFCRKKKQMSPQYCQSYHSCTQHFKRVITGPWNMGDNDYGTNI